VNEPRATPYNPAVKVLIVEDETRLAELLRRGFTGEGYAVDVAGNATDAIWYGIENPYDIIILDVLLPDSDGFAVCEALRDADCWSPIMMLTARTAVDDRVRGLDAGADDYVPKPFSFEELSARVRALLRRGAPVRPAVLRVADLRLDPALHRAWRGDVELCLTAKEMALLELFMRRPDEVITRTDVLAHIWDYAYDGLSNVVDQYVSYLRRKMDKPFGRSDLETIRGVGYRLRSPAAATPGTSSTTGARLTPATSA
jgi:two-component system, OmpR family, response regulator